MIPSCEESGDAENTTEATNFDMCGSAETNQADYVGNISFTANGVECMAWDAQMPHAHSYNPEDYPANELELNYCRNAGGHGAAWCYTMDPLVGNICFCITLLDTVLRKTHTLMVFLSRFVMTTAMFPFAVE